MSTAKKIDWISVTAKLKPSTASQLQSFRTRYAALQKQVVELESQLTDSPINFNNYSSILKNKSLVEEAKKSIESLKLVSYPLQEQLKIVESAKVKAVASAKKTESAIAGELSALSSLSAQIDACRPIEQLTVEDVAKAYPKLDATVEKMAKRGQWRVPGYYEKFGEFSVGF